jgi:hypothetical protein
MITCRVKIRRGLRSGEDRAAGVARFAGPDRVFVDLFLRLTVVAPAMTLS